MPAAVLDPPPMLYNYGPDSTICNNNPPQPPVPSTSSATGTQNYNNFFASSSIDDIDGRPFEASVSCSQLGSPITAQDNNRFTFLLQVVIHKAKIS